MYVLKISMHANNKVKSLRREIADAKTVNHTTSTR